MDAKVSKQTRLSLAQKKWLRRGLTQPGGKLPLFDENGKKFSRQVVRKCVEEGWAEPWFANQLKPDWLVCKLTESGRTAVSSEDN
ncbi:MAG: hypothetical protein P8L66_09785 [Rhodospirillaceae bacterium]|nr:hypothetical protein [Rhodospirillaceae bacterium]